jgi:RNA polymerase sigma-70 factor (ECF subfamily)
MVQETYLRYQSTPKDDIRSLKAYLSTILIRLCMDQLQLARRKREQYVGPWLPEPILTADTAEVGDPQERVDKHESISLAFLVLLEQLQPFERAVFLMREVFEYDFAEIATMLGKSEAACRRSFSRAKLHLREHRPRFGASAETHRQLLSGYFQAIETGEMIPLMNLLSENVTLWADGGGKVKGAATRPLTGREAVARFSVGARKRFVPPAGAHVEMAVVNGETALVIRVGAQAVFLLSIEVEQGRIQAIRIMANPEKLTRV